MKTTHLKRLVDEMEIVLSTRGDVLGAPAHEEFAEKINALRMGIDELDEKGVTQRATEALQLLASLLSAVTNVIALWK